MSKFTVKKVPFKFIVTSGPTREFVDPIRFLSNPSTGKMGFCIAKAAVNLGYEVTYISGTVAAIFRDVKGARNISVVSTRDMLDAVLSEVESSSALIMAAAPADYRPEIQYDKKIKKTEAPSIKLIPNPDILKTVDLKRTELSLDKFFLVGFAAETHNVIEYAQGKLKSKNLDMIFLNDLTRQDSGFGVATNQLYHFKKSGDYEKWESDSKEKLGYRIIEEVLEII